MKLFVDREKDLDLDLISFVEKKKTKKKNKIEKACEPLWRCLLLEGFSAMLISVFLGTGRGGSLRLKEERGLLMADALQQEASQKERERWSGRQEEGATDGLYLNTVNLRNCELQI